MSNPCLFREHFLLLKVGLKLHFRLKIKDNWGWTSENLTMPNSEYRGTERGKKGRWSTQWFWGCLSIPPQNLNFGCRWWKMHYFWVKNWTNFWLHLIYPLIKILCTPGNWWGGGPLQLLRSYIWKIGSGFLKIGLLAKRFEFEDKCLPLEIWGLVS